MSAPIDVTLSVAASATGRGRPFEDRTGGAGAFEETLSDARQSAPDDAPLTDPPKATATADAPQDEPIEGSPWDALVPHRPPRASAAATTRAGALGESADEQAAASDAGDAALASSLAVATVETANSQPAGASPHPSGHELSPAAQQSRLQPSADEDARGDEDAANEAGAMERGHILPLDREAEIAANRQGESQPSRIDPAPSGRPRGRHARGSDARTSPAEKLAEKSSRARAPLPHQDALERLQESEASAQGKDAAGEAATEGNVAEADIASPSLVEKMSGRPSGDDRPSLDPVALRDASRDDAAESKTSLADALARAADSRPLEAPAEGASAQRLREIAAAAPAAPDGAGADRQAPAGGLEAPAAGRSPGAIVAGQSAPAGRAEQASRIDKAQLLQRVTRAFQAAQRRDGEVRLRLSPPELGSLRIELKVEDGALTAYLEAESEAARSLLLENLPTLRQRLAEQSVRVEQFQVEVSDRDDRPQDGRSFEQHGEASQRRAWRTNGRADSHPDSPPAGRPLATESPPLPGVDGRGLNVVV